MLRLKEICAEKGIKYSAVSEATGITESRLCSIVRTGACQLKTLRKIAKALDVPLVKLFENTNHENYTYCPHCGKRIGLKFR
ncbi:MAG: helix-turn-helix transcriptional regulator [Marinilabiliaceae bacterium]|nr:helix-turn-helix transcriptional regulator [Marinilabiliaceae bacterium]